jgi:hypothetical protein
MQDLVSSIIELLFDLRDRYWELDESQPIWLWLGIRWCLSWLAVHADIEE